jgi:hypothetical protein
MAYTIKVHIDAQDTNAKYLMPMLTHRAELEGFKIGNATLPTWSWQKGAKEGSRKPGFVIELRRVRLDVKKPYCGNHPGPCEAGGPKMKATYLEWDDWVRFHGIVNDCLDTLGFDADVWSTPQDCKGRFWMRKGRTRRVRYDYTETVRFGRPLRLWNPGTDDQFVSEEAAWNIACAKATEDGKRGVPVPPLGSEERRGLSLAEDRPSPPRASDWNPPS